MFYVFLVFGILEVQKQYLMLKTWKATRKSRLGEWAVTPSEIQEVFGWMVRAFQRELPGVAARLLTSHA